MTFAHDFYLHDFTSEIIIPQLFSRDLKLSIYSITLSISKRLVQSYIQSSYILWDNLFKHLSKIPKFCLRGLQAKYFIQLP